ncbi:MAG: chromate transporter [Erysipelotrichaceae bacterium]|nr:chromate transporter [Erysipelotrichaceae bacterium]
MSLLITLYIEFFKTGLFALGGGLATIPFLSKMGAQFNWFSNADLANMIAVSESTPGPIGINMATYVGFTVAGLPGAIIATIGEITPSLIIIMIVANFLKKFKENDYVQAAFTGIRPLVVGLISSAVVGIITSSVLFVDKFKASGNILDMFDIRVILIFCLTFILNKKLKLHPVFYLLGAALLGILFSL